MSFKMAESTARSLVNPLRLLLCLYPISWEHWATYRHFVSGLEVTNKKHQIQNKKWVIYIVTYMDKLVSFRQQNSSAAKVIKIILDGARIRIQSLMNNSSSINSRASLGNYPKYIPMEFLRFKQYKYWYI